MSYRTISYWFDSLGVEPEPRPSLPGDLEVDVAIVGGGYTGLWAAYYLKQADPSCRVAVLERDAPAARGVAQQSSLLEEVALLHVVGDAAVPGLKILRS